MTLPLHIKPHTKNALGINECNEVQSVTLTTLFRILVWSIIDLEMVDNRQWSIIGSLRQLPENVDFQLGCFLALQMTPLLQHAPEINFEPCNSKGFAGVEFAMCGSKTTSLLDLTYQQGIQLQDKLLATITHSAYTGMDKIMCDNSQRIKAGRCL